MARKIKMLVMDVDGVLTDAGMYYDQNGNELKKFNTRDGKGIELLRDAGLKTAIITSENTKIVENRANKLKIDFLYQGIKDKGVVLKEITRTTGISLENVAYIGDDVNDIEAIKIAGLSACPNDAEDQIKEMVEIVLSKNGGCGVVREYCNLILNNYLN